MIPDILCSDLVFLIPDARLYHLGVLQSNVHMAWGRAVCGRMKSDYRYSKDIVYNNYPWPTPAGERREKIGQTAQTILDARALYPDASLADLYDDLAMPPELRKAHHPNDRAVWETYGKARDIMKLYQTLTEADKQPLHENDRRQPSKAGACRFHRFLLTPSGIP